MVNAAESESVFLKIAELSRRAAGPGGSVRSREFLDACAQVVLIVERLGAALAIVKSDVGGNIGRLEERLSQRPQEFCDLFALVLADISAGTAADTYSASRALLWLKRAMEFVVNLLRRLHDNPELSLSEAASEAYTVTLYRYHGWITSAAFTVALKLVPYRDTFFSSLELPPGADANAQIQECITAFSPLLATVNDFLVKESLDDPARV